MMIGIRFQGKGRASLMVDLITAMAAFLATHLIPAFGPVRSQLVRSLGRPLYIAMYSAISIGALAWLVLAYQAAPVIELWPVWPWTRWVPVVAMPVACILLVGAFSAPNPLSISLTGATFDPARPGIVSITRHPLMWGLALWAGSHLAPNGDGASVLLFGMLTVLCLAGLVSLDIKARSRLGAAQWRRLASTTSLVPFAAVLTGRAPLDVRGIGWKRAVTALLLYGALFFGHPYVIGVVPLP